jgi:hypothetical protein
VTVSLAGANFYGIADSLERLGAGGVLRAT